MILPILSFPLIQDVAERMPGDFVLVKLYQFLGDWTKGEENWPLSKYNEYCSILSLNFQNKI